MENTHKKSNLQLLCLIQSKGLLINDFIDVHFHDGKLMLNAIYSPELAVKIQDICGEHEFDRELNWLCWTYEDVININLELQ